MPTFNLNFQIIFYRFVELSECPISFLNFIEDLELVKNLGVANKDVTVIFAIDISGSMAISTNSGLKSSFDYVKEAFE